MKSDWIKVDDRLPEDGVNVLAAMADGLLPFIAVYLAEYGWSHDLHDPDMKPTHWMPLPASPAKTYNSITDADDFMTPVDIACRHNQSP